MSTKRRKRHSPDHIVRMLRDADAILNAGTHMITSTVKSQVDKTWNTFWSGGILQLADRG